MHTKSRPELNRNSATVRPEAATGHPDGTNVDATALLNTFTDTLLESLPVRVFLKDTNGVLLACNSLFASDFGCPKRELIGNPASGYASVELLEAVARTDKEVVRTRQPLTYEARERRADGSYRYGLITKSPFFNSDGSVAGIIGVLIDTTEKKHAEDQMRLASGVFEHTIEGIYVADENNRIIDVNPALLQISQFNREDVIGQNPRFLAADENDPIAQELWQSVVENGMWQGEIVNRRKSGELYPAWATVSVIRDEQGARFRHIGIFNDFSERKAAEERIRWLAQHDYLTGLANRSLLQDRIDTAIWRAHRYRTRIAIMLIDLNQFKPVNDQFGHHVGDEVLKCIAERLSECVRQSDTIARFGGDEFVVCVADLADRASAEKLARKILDELARPMDCGGHSINVGISMGISLYPGNGDTPEALLRAADAAMYQVKGSGRNAWHMSEDGE